MPHLHRWSNCDSALALHAFIAQVVTQISKLSCTQHVLGKAIQAFPRGDIGKSGACKMSCKQQGLAYVILDEWNKVLLQLLDDRVS